MTNALLDYCARKNITIEQLAEITEVSVAQLYLINRKPDYNVTISTINNIYTGTKQRFGEGLAAFEYLSHECFYKK